jgi:4-carboxymuconolactone decarboxylase
VVILRVAHLQGSRYELSQHVGIARNAGLADQQINAILDTDHPDAAGFSDTERTALDVTTELCTTHRLRDDTFAAAQVVFGDEALTELLMIISCYYGLALVLNAADLDVDGTARFQP